jgi:hypothetical protein
MATTNNKNNSSNNNELSTPLIGNDPIDHYDRPQHERDEEQGYMPCSALRMAMGYDEEEQPCHKAADANSWFKNFVVMIILPSLLFLQFGIAFSDSPVQGTTGLPWSMVNSNIVLFVITAALYRQAVQDFQMTCSVALLLFPLILVDAILGLVLCGQVVPAFLVLISSILCLAFFVLANSIRVLVGEKECDEEPAHDELKVGFEPLWTL